MALKRPTPKTLSPEAQAAIISASAKQTQQSTRVRSYDAAYPVFEVPVNSKVLAYIPNHVLTAPDGSIELRMDKFAAHPVIDGRTFDDIRCSDGIIVPELGLDGTCPLCNAMNDEWQLYNFEYEDIARSKGIATDAPEAKEALKQDRKNLLEKFPIKQKNIWYVFPIVIIECEEKDGKMTTTPKKDANGQIIGHPMWYQIREMTYQDKWIAGFDSIDSPDGVPTSPAGLWAVLSFMYKDKDGNSDKMGSARSLKVTFKGMAGYEEWAAYYDKLTEDWTIEKAQEVLALCAVRDMAEMNEVTDTLMRSTRDRLAQHQLYSGKQAPAIAAKTPADNALSQFGGVPVENGNGGVAQPPNTGGAVAGTGAGTGAGQAPAAPAAPPTVGAPSMPNSNVMAEMPSSSGVE